MPLAARNRISLLAIALAIAGCAVAPPTTSKPKAPSKRTDATATGKPTGPVDALSARPPGAVALAGKVKLLSDHGAGLVSNNGGGVISNHGGGLISNNGGGVIANNGGGLIANNGGGVIANNGGGLVAKTKYGLAQATPAPATTPAAAAPAEFFLADAEITILDAKGTPLLDAQGQPIRTTTDRTGAYTLTATLPKRNLVMRIKLWNGGELSAILTPEGGAAAAGPREVAIDTASTLGANYVLQRFVKGDQGTYDKLPSREAERLRGDLLAAQAKVRAVPTYTPDALVGLADALRREVPAVDQTFKDIEALLLGGFGDGRAATMVALSRPRAMALAPDGDLLIGEQDFGRIRRVSPAGTITNWVDGVGGVIKRNFAGIRDFEVTPDGALLIASARLNQVFRLGPDGEAKAIVGSGVDPLTLPADQAPAAGPATATAVTPTGLALAADGTLWVAQDIGAQVFKVTPDGTCTPVGRPPKWDAGSRLGGLALGPDGAVYLLGRRQKAGEIARLGTDGAWTIVAKDLAPEDGDLAVGPDGTFYVCEDREGLLTRIAPDGTRTTLVGPGAGAGAPPLVTPAGLRLAPDGTLYVADKRTNQVYARDPAGAWRHLAGAAEGVQQGDDLTINAPTGIAFDQAGRLLITEGAGHALKRWDGKTLTTLAGGTRGDAGDGGPATAARFDSPWSVLPRGDELLVMDSINGRIRAIAADGRVRTVVGVPGDSKGEPLQPGKPVPADAFVATRGAAMILGPDGMVYWTSTSLHQIQRLRPDGMVELVAGKPYGEADQPEDGEDGPAGGVGLASPYGLAFDPKDATTLYFTDLINMRVRKVVGVGTPAARVETVIGLGRANTLVALLGLAPGWEQAVLPARESFLVAPAALAFDAAGALYVTEVGTENVTQLGGGGDASATYGDTFSALPTMKARIRRLTADGRLEAIAGPGGKVLADPDGPNPMGMPTGLLFDRDGRMVFVDVRANAIRFVPRKGW